MSLHNPTTTNARTTDLLEPGGNSAAEPVKSSLDFLVSHLARSMSLTQKQTTALFAENNKYLAHIISKGVQGAYEPVVSFFDGLL